jgi:hypothetical protein
MVSDMLNASVVGRLLARFSDQSPRSFPGVPTHQRALPPGLSPTTDTVQPPGKKRNERAKGLPKPHNVGFGNLLLFRFCPLAQTTLATVGMEPGPQHGVREGLPASLTRNQCTDAPSIIQQRPASLSGRQQVEPPASPPSSVTTAAYADKYHRDRTNHIQTVGLWAASSCIAYRYFPSLG